MQRKALPLCRQRKHFFSDLLCTITGCNVTLPTEKAFLLRFTLHDYRMQRHVADRKSISSPTYFARLQDATSRCRQRKHFFSDLPMLDYRMQRHVAARPFDVARGDDTNEEGLFEFDCAGVQCVVRSFKRD